MLTLLLLWLLFHFYSFLLQLKCELVLFEVPLELSSLHLTLCLLLSLVFQFHCSVLSLLFDQLDFSDWMIQYFVHRHPAEAMNVYVSELVFVCPSQTRDKLLDDVLVVSQDNFELRH